VTPNQLDLCRVRARSSATCDCGRPSCPGVRPVKAPVARTYMSAICKLAVGLLCRRRATLRRRANQVHIFGRLVPIYEGRFAIVTNVRRGMRWTHWCCSAHSRADEQHRCGREIVWSWRRGAGAKFAMRFGERRERRGQNSRSPGRVRISVKTIAQGRPDVRLVPVVLPRAFLLHAGHGCGQHPAFPAPSIFEGDVLAKLGRDTRREIASVWISIVMPRAGGASSIPETSESEGDAAAYWIARLRGR